MSLPNKILFYKNHLLVMKDIKQKELSTLTPQKRNYSTIIIFVVTILLFSGLGAYLQFGEMPVAESTFFQYRFSSLHKIRETIKAKQKKPIKVDTTTFIPNKSVKIGMPYWWKPKATDHKKPIVVFDPQSEVKYITNAILEMNNKPELFDYYFNDEIDLDEFLLRTNRLTLNFMNTISEKQSLSYHEFLICNQILFFPSLFSQEKRNQLITLPNPYDGKIELSSISITGSPRSENSIKKVILENHSILENVYKQYLEINSNVVGHLVAKIIISPSGIVIRATILESSFYEPKFERELMKKMKRFKFVKVKKGNTTQILRMDFGYHEKP